MPLKCMRDGEAVYAFKYVDDEWTELKVENRERRCLTMSCCGAGVVLKTSKLGTRFFAHSRIGECATSPETAEHLLAKSIIAKAVQIAGWEVSTEFAKHSPAGVEWVADVMATKEHRSVAIEVQWSRQEQEETKRRQERYWRSRVRGLWLMRHPNLLVEKETPMFRLRYKEDSHGFSVLMPSPHFDVSFIGNHNKDDLYFWQQEIDLFTFVVGALNGRLKFAPAIDRRMPVNVKTAPVECWRCKKDTNIVIGIEFEAGKILKGHSSITANIYDFEEIKECELLEKLFPLPLLKRHSVGQIKRRFSRTTGFEYLSNGCIHCDALQGRFFDHEHWHEATVAYTVEAELSDTWASQLVDSHDQIFRWWFDEA